MVVAAKVDGRLTRVRRGVRDVDRCAEFVAWLLDVAPRQLDHSYVFALANGDLVVDGELSEPIGFEFISDLSGDPSAAVALDHVALGCADLAAAVDEYRSMGLVVTWSGRDDGSDAHGAEPLDDATWVHVSGADGYLALGQTTAGATGFRHVGFAAADLGPFVSRLESAGIWYDPAPTSPIGQRLYLNDPEGEPATDTNIELVHYAPGVERSGRIDSAP